MEDIRRPTIRQRSNGALNLSNVITDANGTPLAAILTGGQPS